MLYILPTDTCLWLWCSIDDDIWYKNIYKLKKRPLKKPLSVMVESFSWLDKNTILTWEQIEFLKKYPKPFTILTKSPYLTMFLGLEDENDKLLYENWDLYDKIAFRVAHNDIQKELIWEVGSIFLTSANLSGDEELYDFEVAKELFKNTKDIKFLWTWSITKTPPSDIFEFIWDSLEINYLRKN